MPKRLLLVAMIGLFFSVPAFAGGAWETDAQAYSIRYENNKVRVLDVTYELGKSVVSHTLRDRLIIVQKTGRLRTEDSSGLKKEFDIREGEISWEKADTLKIENIGTTQIKAIYIEIK